jgi:hypothetical protein
MKSRDAAREIGMRSTGWLAGGCWLLGTALAAVQPGGSTEGAYEEVVVQTLAALDLMTKILVTVKDAPSAEAARPDLKQAAVKFVEVRKKAEQLKQPDQTQKDLIAKKFEKNMAKAVQQLRAEIRRVQDVPGGLNLLKELDPVLKYPPKK